MDKTVPTVPLTQNNLIISTDIRHLHGVFPRHVSFESRECSASTTFPFPNSTIKNSDTGIGLFLNTRLKGVPPFKRNRKKIYNRKYR